MKEKDILFHLLNLSAISIISVHPLKLISTIYEYFKKFITDFSIEIIYRVPNKNTFLYVKSKKIPEETPINIDEFNSFINSKTKKKIIQIEEKEKKKLNKTPNTTCSVYPIFYNNNLLGFLLFFANKKHDPEVELKIFYIKILANIIAHSIQHHYISELLKTETKKKELIKMELFRIEKESNDSKKILVDCQKSEIFKEMLPIIFHKLKNKLTPILGYSQILSTITKEDSINQRVKKIEKSATELTNHLNLLRDYFGEDKIIKKKENLNDIIYNLRPFFIDIKNNKNIEVNLNIDYAIPDDLLVSGQIESLIINLINNSVNAINKKNSDRGIIDVKTELKDNTYRLVIKDNGIGIKKEDIEKIWTPFYTTFPGRVGIGLSVCQKILLNHNTSININSVEGKYTELIIEFKNKLFEEEKTEKNHKIKKEIPKKILIIDDDECQTDLMKEILLDKSNINITVVTRNKDAINLINNNNFDLIISDIKRPEINGIEIYELLKSKKSGNKIIMITSDSHSKDVSRFLKENKINYLTKPIYLIRFKRKVFEKLL